MEPLLQALALAIQPCLDKPFAFFGHSLGAKICFELARHLRAQGALLPVHLFFSGSSAPQIINPGPPIHTLPDVEFAEMLRRFNGTPETLLQNEELLRLLPGDHFFLRGSREILLETISCDLNQALAQMPRG
jgi:medium-chain acyl-[acyl-carrier-protein] hydrolase